MLRVFSQRLMLWLGNHTLPLIVLGMGLYLWQQAMTSPSVLQLVGLGLFGAFSLLLILIRGVRK